MANLPENATLRRSLVLGPAVLNVGAYMLLPVAIIGV